MVFLITILCVFENCCKFFAFLYDVRLRKILLIPAGFAILNVVRGNYLTWNTINNSVKVYARLTDILTESEADAYNLHTDIRFKNRLRKVYANLVLAWI